MRDTGIQRVGDKLIDALGHALSRGAVHFVEILGSSHHGPGGTLAGLDFGDWAA